MLLQACLGQSVDGSALRVHFDRPRLPPYLERLSLRWMQVGRASLDLEMTRDDQGVVVNQAGGEAAVEVSVER